MHFRGVKIGKIIETAEDLMDHSYSYVKKQVQLEPIIETVIEPEKLETGTVNDVDVSIRSDLDDTNSRLDDDLETIPVQDDSAPTPVVVPVVGNALKQKKKKS